MISTRTRIKIVIDGFGNTKYYIQVRSLWFFWLYIRDYSYYGQGKKVELTTLEKAKREIDEYLSARKQRELEKQKSVSFVRYP